MLEITKQAAAHLIRLRAEEGLGPDSGARFVRGTSSVALTFASQPEPGDVVLDGYDLPVYVAKDLVEVLDRSVIDETTDGDGPRLAVRPQVSAPATR